MKSIKTILVALMLSVPLSLSAFAESMEDLCLEEVKHADIPPEVTQEQLDSYCSCYGSAIESDQALTDEANYLLTLAREERGEKASETIMELEQTCQAEAMAG